MVTGICIFQVRMQHSLIGLASVIFILLNLLSHLGCWSQSDLPGWRTLAVPQRCIPSTPSSYYEFWVGRVVEQATSSCPSGYQPDALKWRDPACHCQSPAYIASLGCSCAHNRRRAHEGRLQNSRHLTCVRIWTL